MFSVTIIDDCAITREVRCMASFPNLSLPFQKPEHEERYPCDVACHTPYSAFHNHHEFTFFHMYLFSSGKLERLELGQNILTCKRGYDVIGGFSEGKLTFQSRITWNLRERSNNMNTMNKKIMRRSSHFPNGQCKIAGEWSCPAFINLMVSALRPTIVKAWMAMYQSLSTYDELLAA